MRALALDIGEVRIGIAASDMSGNLAFPLKVLPTSEVLAGSRSFRTILEDFEPEIIVCGLPRTLQGEEGKQAARIKELAADIATRTELPLVFVDERFSSQEAKRILHEEGLSERAMRGKIDMIAASLFLQTWLEAQKMERSTCE